MAKETGIFKMNNRSRSPIPTRCRFFDELLSNFFKDFFYVLRNGSICPCS
jgi:hypothetical protein